MIDDRLANDASMTMNKWNMIIDDKLDDDSGEYVVEIESGRTKKSVKATLGDSVNLGEIRL